MKNELITGADNSITARATLNEYDRVIGFIESKLEEFECPVGTITKITVASDEVLANIINYAYVDREGTMSVSVEKTDDGKGITLTFCDEGIPFNPLEAKEPDTDLPVEKRKIGGLGIFMVRKLMDKVEYEYTGKNILKITKFFKE